jgi:pilus assembly protein CpaB
VAGATRLSTAPLLRPGLRAMAVQITDVSGVSGLVFPGDRVDVLMTRQPEEAMPHAELLAQDVRVLAVGSDMNIARDKPGMTKTVTLELNPLQAQKLTLAAANATISLALRQFSDESRIRLPSLQVSDLNDGTPTRLVKKPGTATPAAPARPPASAPRPPAAVIVVRGGEATEEPVLR